MGSLIDSDEDVRSSNSLGPMNSNIPDGEECPNRDHLTAESPSPTLSNQNQGLPLPGKGGLNYVPNMEMALRLSSDLRSDLLAAMKNADSASAPDPMRIPSELCRGESRQETLKRTADHISRSTSEFFAYCTSRTSIEDAAQLLSAVTNLSFGTYLI